jgi:hypothetical protein
MRKWQTVWRVEDPETGAGAYQAGWGCMYSSKRHPGPRFDGLTRYGLADRLFGFPTVAAYRRWFRKRARVELRNGPMRLVEYKCPVEQVELSKSLRQCTFSKRAAKRISVRLP